MEGGIDARARAPFGPLGLVLSLAGWIALTAIYSVALFGLAALADGALSGRAGMLVFIDMLREALFTRNPAYILPRFAAGLVLYLAMALASLSLALFRGGPNWRALVAWPIERRWWRDRAFWFLVAAAIGYDALASAILSRFYPPSNSWFNVPPSWTALLLSFLLVAVAAPISEELLFRGWIYTSLRSRFGALLSVIVSALLFASAHYNPRLDPAGLYPLAVLPVGLILGALREREGTFWATASLHALYNFSAWLFLAFGAG